MLRNGQKCKKADISCFIFFSFQRLYCMFPLPWSSGIRFGVRDYGRFDLQVASEVFSTLVVVTKQIFSIFQAYSTQTTTVQSCSTQTGNIFCFQL